MIKCMNDQINDSHFVVRRWFEPAQPCWCQTRRNTGQIPGNWSLSPCDEGPTTPEIEPQYNYHRTF